MTGRLPRIRRGSTTAAEAPTRLNRPDVAAADSAEGRAGVESVVEPAVAEAPILITEQEVFFSSAADERPAKHRHYPQHYVFLEQTLMAREMERC